MAKKFYKSYENYAGYVYILSNPLISGIKIGCTTRTVAARLSDINQGSGVPAYYKEEYSVYTRRVEYLEKKMHDCLLNHRIKNSREFFDISVDDAKDILNKLFRQVEDEIDNDPKLKRIFDCINWLSKLLKKIDYHSDTLRYKKVKKDLAYLRHSGYSLNKKYEKLLEIEYQIKSLKGY